jgi:hypothetical protein
MAIKVGTFAKATGAAPVSQTVTHNLGETPKALILWMTSKAATGSNLTNIYFSYGFTDGSTSRCVVGQGSDGSTESFSSRRHAAKLLALVDFDQALICEAAFTSWTSTQFTINWETNNPDAIRVHYMIIGGANVDAKVVEWNTPSTTGNKVVTGVNFKPSVVLHMGVSSGTAPPMSSTSRVLVFGAMDAVGNQWAIMENSQNNQAVAVTRRIQRTDRCYVDGSFGASSPNSEATFVSMDDNGFTVNFSTTVSGDYVFSLCLRDINAKVGNFTKSSSAAPVTQTVSGVGFQPRGLLFFNANRSTTETGMGNDSELSVGGSDGTTQVSVSFKDTNGADPMVAKTKVNESEAIMTGVLSTDTEGDIDELDSDGFTVILNPNNTTANRVIPYIALSDLPLSKSGSDACALTEQAGPVANVAQTDTMSLAEGVPNTLLARFEDLTFVDVAIPGPIAMDEFFADDVLLLQGVRTQDTLTLAELVSTSAGLETADAFTLQDLMEIFDGNATLKFAQDVASMNEVAAVQALIEGVDQWVVSEGQPSFSLSTQDTLTLSEASLISLSASDLAGLVAELPSIVATITSNDIFLFLEAISRTSSATDPAPTVGTIYVTTTPEGNQIITALAIGNVILTPQAMATIILNIRP